MHVTNSELAFFLSPTGIILDPSTSRPHLTASDSDVAVGLVRCLDCVGTGLTHVKSLHRI